MRDFRSRYWGGWLTLFVSVSCVQPETDSEDASRSIIDTEAKNASEKDPSRNDTETVNFSAGRYAEGIQIARFEANQGAAVSLIDAGRIVPSSDRKVGLIRGRPTLFRAFWSLDVSWTPRVIMANLILSHADGATETIQTDMQISGPPDAENLDGAFHWPLAADAVLPGTRFAIELLETAHSQYGTAEPGVGVRVPKSGTEDLNISDALMELNMVLVPFASPGQSGVSIGPTDRGEVETALMEFTPIQKAIVDWRDPIPQSKFYDHPEEAWTDIHDLRTALELAPNQYLHVLLDPTTCCNKETFDFTGLGGNPGASKSAEDARKRSAMVMILVDVGSAAPFIVHELGHNHGLKHAPCGDVDDVDPAYPYPGGLTRTDGYGILTEKLYSGNPDIAHPFYDMMTYCWPVWFSDYHFEAMRKRIEIISSW